MGCGGHSAHATAVQLNGLKNGLATLLFLPVLLEVPWREQPMAVAALFVSGAIGIALGDSLYLAALRRIGTRRTLTLEATGPVLASLGSPLIQGDPLTVTDFAGALLVAAAVLMIARSGSQIRPPESATEQGSCWHSGLCSAVWSVPLWPGAC